MRNARMLCLMLLLLTLLVLPVCSLAENGQISGVAWYDLAGDLTYEEGDRLQNRVAVVLYRLDGDTETQMGKVITGSDGAYAFTDLPAGEYRLSITLPADHNFVMPADGGSVILPGSGTTGSSPVIALEQGQQITDAHIGVSKSSGYVKVFVFADENSNGGRRATEDMLYNIPTQLLYEHNGEWIVVETMKTGRDGCATYWELTPGTYRMAVDLPSPYIIGPLGEKINAWYNCVPPADSNRGITEPFEVPRGGSIGLGVGAVKTGKLTGSFWYDTNCNGKKDKGEMPFQGASIQLENVAAGVHRTLMSETDGGYLFDNLPEGDYTLTVTLPDIYMFTLPGGDSLLTGGASFSDSVVASVRMEKTTSMQSIGVIPVTTLALTLYNDLNANGVKEESELPFAGAVLDVFSGDALVASARSDGNGLAYIPILRGGQLTVRCTLPDGQVFTVGGADNQFVSPDARSVVSLSVPVEHGQANRLIAGVTVSAGVSGQLFDDPNVSGIKDSNETGLAGFTVQAVNHLGEIAAQTTTDETGAYRFDALLPAAHTIRFLLQDAYVFSAYDDSAAPVRNQVVKQTAEYGETAVIALHPGQTAENINAGAFRSATVSGKVLLSAGPAAEQLSGGLENVFVCLITEDGKPVSETTATYTLEDGSFYLKGALPGVYCLEVTLPEDHAFVQPLLDSNVYITESFKLNTADDLQFETLLAVPTCSLNGQLYYDSNVNGVFDGESTLSGIAVTLTNTDCNMTYEARTLENGEYSFSMLRPGAYTMSVSLPEGYAFGVDATSLIAATTENSAHANFVLLSGERLNDRDLAAVKPAQLNGIVYFDAENNNRPDNGDMGAQGVTLTLKSTDDAHSYTVITDGSGAFTFAPIVPGNYELLVSLTADCIPSDGNPAVLTDGFYQSTLLIENSENAEMTYAILRYASVSGHVWSIDGSLTGVSGRMITLYDENGLPIAQTQTNEIGAYSIGGLKPGNYMLSCDLPGSSYQFARAMDVQDMPSIITRDACEIIDGAGSSAPFHVAMGQSKDDRHIGIGASGKLGDTAWLDENGNGLQDAGESGIPGIIVTVYQYGEKVAETVTDAFGHYLFTDLFPGVYTVEVTMPKEIGTTVMRTDYPMVASVLPESTETTVRAENIIVPSGSRNLNCDFGFTLRKKNKYPAMMANPPQTDWDY